MSQHNESSAIEDRQVLEIMTKNLLTVAPDETVNMAWELMTRAGCHHLPVVTAEGHVVGVLTEADLLIHWESGGPHRVRQAVALLIEGKTVPRIPPTATVHDAATAMAQENVDVVSVTDDEGILVGLVTARDIIDALAGRTPHREGTMSGLFRIEPVIPTAGAPRRPQMPPD